MSTTVLYDRVHISDGVHVVEIITDPTAQVIEEVRWHCDDLRPSHECGHDFEAAMSADDALDIRAQLLAAFEEDGETLAESAILSVPSE